VTLISPSSHFFPYAYLVACNSTTTRIFPSLSLLYIQNNNTLPTPTNEAAKDDFADSEHPRYLRRE
jgi:hypothetical protein